MRFFFITFGLTFHIFNDIMHLYLFVDIKPPCFKQQLDQICVTLTGGQMQTRHTIGVLQNYITLNCMVQ